MALMKQESIEGGDCLALLEEISRPKAPSEGVDFKVVIDSRG